MSTNKIILHKYPEVYNLLSLSPFCLKVEYFLLYYKIPYKNKIEINPAKGPNHKMPFIEFKKNKIADSTIILDFLIEKFHININSHLNHEQIALEFAYTKLIEETLYFILLYSRWIDKKSYPITASDFKPLFPYFFRNIGIKLIQRSLKKQAYAQGISRYPESYIYNEGIKILEIFNQKLDNKDYLFNNKISKIDFTLFSFLITLKNSPLHTNLHQHIYKCENILRYIKNFELMVH